MTRSTFQRAVQEGRIPFVTKLPGVTAAYLFDANEIESLANSPAGATHPTEKGVVA